MDNLNSEDAKVPQHEQTKMNIEEEDSSSKTRKHPERRRTAEVSQQSSAASSMFTHHDLEIIHRLEEEYDRAVEEREVHYAARYHSVRQSACFSVGFMIVFILLGTIFFLKQTDWGIQDSLLFSIYTITTVGWGHLDTPETPTFQLYVIMFIFVGVATLTIMVAQVYQWIALEAGRAQHSRDNHDRHFYRRHRKNRIRNNLPGVWNSGASADGANSSAARENNHASSQTHSADTSDVSSEPTGHDLVWEATVSYKALMLERLWTYLDRIRYFLRENEYGRSISVLIPFTFLILLGAMVIGPLEGWGPIESIYFACVSLTTVGYGDYYPTQTASVWFTILWLPFSVGFMSLFLANVAAFYIRLSDQNISRIERHLRKRVVRAKQKAAQEREAARQRAMRGQQLSDTSSVGNRNPDNSSSPNGSAMSQGDNDDALNGSLSPGQRLSHTVNRRIRGFATLPESDEEEPAIAADGGRISQQHLFGTPEDDPSLRKGPNRREQILLNSQQRIPSTMRIRKTRPNENGKTGSDTDVEADRQSPTSGMTTMKAIVDRVKENLRQPRGKSVHRHTESDHATAAAMSYLNLRSNDTMHQHSRTVRKPSLGLRALVQERFAEIIAIDIAGYQSQIEIHDQTLTMTIDILQQVCDKWKIPRRARRAFRSVAFESLCFVGEHGLITRGADALMELTPLEFHRLFAPLLAALGDAETMEHWLDDTEVLAEVDLKGNGCVQVELDSREVLTVLGDSSGKRGNDSSDDELL